MIGNWTPGIGDPSTMGWLTVFSYYGAASLCVVAAVCAGVKRGKGNRAFRITMSFFMALLGLGKQYNLPSAITEAVRIIARAGGWMDQRRIVQFLFMAGFSICGIAAVAIVARKIPRAFLVQYRLTLFCAVYLLAFVVFRAVSLHQWGTVLNYTIFGMRINWIGELAGIYGVCVSVLIDFLSKKNT